MFFGSIFKSNNSNNSEKNLVLIVTRKIRLSFMTPEFSIGEASVVFTQLVVYIKWHSVWPRLRRSELGSLCSFDRQCIFATHLVVADKYISLLSLNIFMSRLCLIVLCFFGLHIKLN